MRATEIPDPKVRGVFAAFPDALRPGLLALRDLILAVAAETPGVGRIEETLRWGQPAYLTPETRAGTTIRLEVPKTGGYALYVPCQTSLIDDFRAVVGDRVRFEGTRAVLFRPGEAADRTALALLIGAALTYHRRNGAP